MWMSVFLALIGLYFLCIKEGFSIGKGDIMIFACALVFAVHILVIDYYSPKVDGVKMSCIQFFVNPEVPRQQAGGGGSRQEGVRCQCLQEFFL